ncbi:hypothetical protein M0R45_030555 [Rubus argutus]|uniref:Uncharacterized protein n=1 Tax=Rubus argutus TaxID=59490 RepID=A0AAW1WBD2_RUBAR
MAEELGSGFGERWHGLMSGTASLGFAVLKAVRCRLRRRPQNLAVVPSRIPKPCLRHLLLSANPYSPSPPLQPWPNHLCPRALCLLREFTAVTKPCLDTAAAPLPSLAPQPLPISSISAQKTGCQGCCLGRALLSPSSRRRVSLTTVGITSKMPAPSSSSRAIPCLRGVGPCLHHHQSQIDVAS